MENVSSLVTPRTSDLRSRRMGGIIQLPSFPAPRQTDFSVITPPISPKDTSSPMASPSSTSSWTSIPPVPPPRSPLRPSPKSRASFATLIDSYTKRDSVSTIRSSEMSSISNLSRNRQSSLSSTTTLQFTLDSVLPSTSTTEILVSDNPSPLGEKPLPSPPEENSLCLLTSTISTASETSTLATITPIITKREHALRELLSSERAYASDLAFIRNVHIPMALGKQAPFHLPRPATPPRSSGSSMRTISTSSESSSGSGGCPPPMTKDDVRIIFGNIAELAEFSSMFTDRLQEALGDILEDGDGEDWVGALFLEIIPQMEPLYMNYITKQPNAVKHLNSLPKTPALSSYLTEAQHHATTVTHAWDLPSLLIKPVQRLLKYSLLLKTIIEQTPDYHGDKKSLKEALEKMEELAQAVNESRRRMEIVKGVLTNRTDSLKPTLQKKLSLGKATHVGVARMKSINLRMPRPKEVNNVETARITELEDRLRGCESFVRSFAMHVASWAHGTQTAQEHLRRWAEDFGKTIGIDPEHPSEAFDAFMDLIDSKLLPICREMNQGIQSKLLPELARLLDSTKAPLRLVATMHMLEPMHNAYLNIDQARNRRPVALAESSQNYLALKAQLSMELPRYLTLFENGVLICLQSFVNCQAEFWSAMREQWSSLWDCLRMEGETNAGCEETLTLWWNRYSEVEEKLSKLNIIKRERPYYPRFRTSEPQSISSITSLDSLVHVPSTSPSTSPSSVLSGNSIRHRNFGSQDYSSLSSGLRRSPSEETFPPVFFTRKDKSNSRSRTYPKETTYRKKGRSNTSPIPLPASSFHLPSSSSSQFSLSSSTSSCPPSSQYRSGTGSGMKEYAESIDSRSEKSNETRGRKSRSSSLSRMITETLRTPLRRTPSQKSFASQRSSGSNINGNIYTHNNHSNHSNHSTGPRGHFILDMDEAFVDAPPLPMEQPYVYHHHHHLRQHQLQFAETGSSVITDFVFTKGNTNIDIGDIINNINIFLEDTATSSTPYTSAPHISLTPIYYVKVAHPCSPPTGASFLELPFFDLEVDTVFGVLGELGHPANYRGLCISVDDGEEDCLLVLRKMYKYGGGGDEFGEVGLALQSFFDIIS